MFKFTITAAALVLLSGCPQPPAPPVPDSGDAALLGDAPDGGVCAALCAHLAALPSESGEPAGCPEGRDPKCERACELNQTAPITVDPVSCWLAAPTKSAARACGSATTGHLRCE